MPEHRLGIIVLAAGASVRMGTPKQLLHIGGASLIRRAAQAAIESEGHPVVVVLGANAELIREELEGLEVQMAVSSEWSVGMSASIRCGVKRLLTLAPEIEGVVLMLADQPEVTGGSLRKLMRAHKGSGLVAARYDNVLGTPALFSREHFGELLQLDGQSGARSLIERHRERVLAIDLPEAARDLDTPEDLAAFNSSHPEASWKSDSDARRSITTGGFTMHNVETTGSSDDVPEPIENAAPGQTRRQFVTQVSVAGTGLAAAPLLFQSLRAAEGAVKSRGPTGSETMPVRLRVNGTGRTLQLDPRVTLLDALREHLDLTGSKKGCDHGQCGACTVLVNGRRIYSCLALAIVHEGDEITTIEGLAKGDELHPMQTAFLEHDGFQCGYCTPGQICSAVALLKEGHTRDDAEIREWMSGNLCRCGAYTNIVAAIREAKTKTAGAL